MYENEPEITEEERELLRLLDEDIVIPSLPPDFERNVLAQLGLPSESPVRKVDPELDSFVTRRCIVSLGHVFQSLYLRTFHPIFQRIRTFFAIIIQLEYTWIVLAQERMRMRTQARQLARRLVQERVQVLKIQLQLRHRWTYALAQALKQVSQTRTQRLAHQRQELAFALAQEWMRMWTQEQRLAWRLVDELGGALERILVRDHVPEWIKVHDYRWMLQQELGQVVQEREHEWERIGGLEQESEPTGTLAQKLGSILERHEQEWEQEQVKQWNDLIPTLEWALERAQQREQDQAKQWEDLIRTLGQTLRRGTDA